MIIYPDELALGTDESLSPESRVLPAKPPSPWRAPPRAWLLPATLSWTGVLATGADARVGLTGVRVWPECLALDLVTVVRRLAFRPPGDGGVRVEVVFADGRRATTSRAATWSSGASRKPPASPVLRLWSSADAGFCRSHTGFLWPLPPPGPLTLVTSWPDLGVAETTRRFDATVLPSMTEKVVPLW